jgi:hypothetical protein
VLDKLLAENFRGTGFLQISRMRLHRRMIRAGGRRLDMMGKLAMIMIHMINQQSPRNDPGTKNDDRGQD